MNAVSYGIPEAAVRAAARWRHDPDIALTEATPHILIAELERLTELMTWESDERVLRERIAELRAVISRRESATPPDAER
jgi:hypothetical protein